jgi:hypothetical protein
VDFSGTPPKGLLVLPQNTTSPFDNTRTNFPLVPVPNRFVNTASYDACTNTTSNSIRQQMNIIV